MDPSLQVQPHGTIAPRKGFFDRNWKWLVAVSVLGGLLLLAVFVGGILLVVFGSVKASDPYKIAIAKAKVHPSVIEALGTPIEEGWLVSGHIAVRGANGASGEAELEIPLQGPKGKGTIYVEAKKSAGEWTFHVLKVKADGQKYLIDLLPEAPPPT